MEANKYYTPKIEDIFLSYECEIIQEDGSWKPIKVDTFQNNISLSDKSILDNLIRTKYLDADDLKELGWELKFDKLETICFEKSANIYLFLNKTTKEISIAKGMYPLMLNYCFHGICPSKNELRKIMSYVGID